MAWWLLTWAWACVRPAAAEPVPVPTAHHPAPPATPAPVRASPLKAARSKAALAPAKMSVPVETDNDAPVVIKPATRPGTVNDSKGSAYSANRMAVIHQQNNYAAPLRTPYNESQLADVCDKTMAIRKAAGGAD